MESKKWYQSWTIWANLLALVLFVANGLGFSDFEPAPWVTEAGTIAILVVNIVLRYVRTRAPIER